jgi:hypothetical protein
VMAVNTFIIYIFGILIFLLIAAIIKSESETHKWTDFFQQLAVETKLIYCQNENGAYPYVAGNYFGRPTKLEFLNIGGFEGVLPTINLCITIQLQSAAHSSLEIKRRDFFLKGQTKMSKSTFHEKYVISSSSGEMLRKILETENLTQKLTSIDFDNLTIEERELKMSRQGKETNIEFMCFCLRSLYHLATLAEGPILANKIAEC